MRLSSRDWIDFFRLEVARPAVRWDWPVCVRGCMPDNAVETVRAYVPAVKVASPEGKAY